MALRVDTDPPFQYLTVRDGNLTKLSVLPHYCRAGHPREVEGRCLPEQCINVRDSSGGGGA
jgi:hypothetical protein